MRYFNLQMSAIAVMSILLLASCSEATVEEEHDAHEEHHGPSVIELNQGQYDVAQIEIGNVELKSLSNTLKVTGIIDAPPKNIISISAPLGGYVVNIDLVDGMKVSKGQKLITLEHQDYIQMQQDYLDKKSQLDYLEKEYERQEKLHNDNVNSDKVYQQTVSQYKSMKAQVTGLKEKLSFIGINASKLNENSISRRIVIYAPAAGFISKVNTNIGKYCNPTDVLVELVNTEHLHAELTVYEKDLAKLKIGQNVRLKLPSVPGEEVMASIYLIGKSIGSDRSIKVHAHFEHENVNMVPGMYVNGAIETESNKVNAVPNESIVSFEGKKYIVVSDGTEIDDGVKMYVFNLLEIETGVSEFGFTEINTIAIIDLSDYKIVVNGAYSILAKLKNEDDGEGHAH